MTIRRLLLPVAVLLALAASLAVAAAAAAPAPARLPAVALGAVLVWRVEIAAVVFAALYGAIVVTRLALHGETLTRVGRDGIEVPRVGSAQTDRRGLEREFAALLGKVEPLVDRLERSDAIHSLLRDDEKDT